MELTQLSRGLTMRVGLAIDSVGIRAVGVRGGEVRWSLETQLDDGEPLETAVVALLSTVSLPRWPRVRLVAAIGPSRSQLKRLSGLPDVGDRAALGRLVHESAGRFFLRNGVPLVTTGLSSVSHEAVWGAAIERPVVEAVAAACRTLRLTFEAAVPAMAVLSAAFSDEAVSWADGPIEMRAAYRGGRIAALERVRLGGVGTKWDEEALGVHDDVDVPVKEKPPIASDESPLAGRQRHVAVGLAVLGEDAWRFADAYGAAMLSPSAQLTYAPGARAEQRAVGSNRRLALAATSCSVAALLAAAAPGLAAVRQERAAVSRLASIADERSAAVAAERELATATAALGEVSGFTVQRRSATLLLAGLTRQLPDESAIVALRVDSAGGSLVVLTARAGTALTRLERVSGIMAPEIVGPVTRELAGTREVERVSVRFRFAPTANTAGVPDTASHAVATNAAGAQ